MLNKVIIMGRLTADPELRQTPSNLSTCRVTVACDRNFVAKGEERQVDFITVVAWRQTAEFITKYFIKGQMIVVEGNLRTSTYNDKKYPDVKHYVTEVYADQVYFGESKKSVNDGGASYGNAAGGNGFGGQSNGQNGNSNNGNSNNYSENKGESATLAIGNINEFEEILGDGQLPF